jgi:predicted transcriptional regulator
MPAQGWKTVAIRDDVYARLAALAGELERPINWTANRAIEHIIGETMREHEDGNVVFDSQTAEEFGLR